MNQSNRASLRPRRRWLRTATVCLRAAALPAALMLAAVVLTTIAPSTAQAADREVQYIEGLRARLLFPLADAYCRQKLAQPDLDPIAQTMFTIERIRTAAEQAVNSPANQRAPLWAQAEQLARQFPANHPRRLLIDVQAALTSLAAGELARFEAEVAGDALTALTAARDQIRKAARALETLDAQLTQAIPAARRSGLKPADLSGDELFSLQNNVRYQLARALRNQALCYPDESPDRVAALTSAVQQLDKTISLLADDDPLLWNIRLDQAVCYRLLGDAARCRTMLARLKDAPAELQPRRLAETVRLSLAAQQPETALQQLAAERIPPTAELDFAHLETLIALWKAASQPPVAKVHQEQAVQKVKWLEQTYGGYWGRRGELLLIRASGGSGSGNLDILARTAENLYRKKEFAEAIATYDKAALQARQDGANELAFQMAYKAARIEQQQKHHREAARRLRRAALAHPRLTHAPAAHLLAAWNLAQTVRQDSSQLDAYREALGQHLQTWPGDPSCGQAGWWLGQLEQSRKKWTEALEAYRQVPVGSDRFADALQGSADCYQQLLNELEGQAAEAAANQAAQYFESVLLSTDRRLPERWSASQRLAALQSARLRLQHTTQGAAYAETVLTAALNGSPQPSDQWKARAEQLLILATAAQPGRLADAQQRLTRLSGGSTPQLLDLLSQLQALADQTPRLKPELAGLQLSLIERLLPQAANLDLQQQKQLQQVQAGALAQAGKQDEARRLLAQLTQKYPNDGRLQVDYATLLLASSSEADQQLALRQWRIIANRSPKNSARWLDARYSIALATFRLGDKKRAAELLQYLLLTAKFSSPDERQRLEKLLAQCGQ